MGAGERNIISGKGELPHKDVASRESIASIESMACSRNWTKSKECTACGTRASLAQDEEGVLCWHEVMQSLISRGGLHEVPERALEGPVEWWLLTYLWFGGED